MTKLKLDIDLILPADASVCDACIKRLIASLHGRSGLKDVHVDTTDTSKPKLCLHYDPSLTQMAEVQALVEQAGAELHGRFEHLSVPVAGLRHERQGKMVEALFTKEAGVHHAAVALGSGRLYLEFDPSKTSSETLLAIIPRAGLDLRSETTESPQAIEKHGHNHEHDHDHGGPFGERSELVFSLFCGVLTTAGWTTSKYLGDSLIPTTLFVAAYLLGSWFTLQELIVALRARKFEIDFLMLLAAVGAAILGEWFEGALLLFLFSLGHALEGFAMGRARKAIEALSKLVPETALRFDASGVATEVEVADLVVGDSILVKPNTRVSADGFVIAGTSSVDQSPITGESVPVDKRPVPNVRSAADAPQALAAEERVFAGTINGPKALTIYVTKIATDSTLARVVKMVAEAETQKSPTQLFTDKFERIFVPVIVISVILLMFAYLVIDEPFAKSFYRAMAVLVAASPCALAIATPSAVLAGVARAARGGVLIKGGAHLESLGMVKAIAFDKTGTLTEGKPKLTDVAATSGTNEIELLQVALAVEKQSDHPLARAIVSGATARLAQSLPDLQATDVEAIIGFGVRAMVGERSVYIGKPGLFSGAASLSTEVASTVEKLQAGGRTVMVVRADDRFLGVLGVMDSPRDSARMVITELHRLGIERTIMLSGDNQRVVDAVAKHVGIKVANGDMLPEQKVQVIVELAQSQSLVAMVGDGVNDAPAMANATVGIAMGAGGSDVALQTADVALMADDLKALPFAVGLSRSARTVIRQNLWASLGMVAFLIPATIFGFAGIGLAVVLHEGSTLLVVANALRLLAYKHKTRSQGANQVVCVEDA